MGYVVEGVAYVSGALLVGAGLFLVMRGTFPAWWQRRFLWPVVRVTPRVAHLHGWAAVGLGASIIAIVFTSVVGAEIGGALVLAALGVYLVALGLFLLSAWLSRRQRA